MSKWNLKYNRGGDVVEVIIRDQAGGKVDKFKGSMSDFPRIVKIIQKKYGIKFKPEIDKDLSWLKGEED